MEEILMANKENTALTIQSTGYLNLADSDFGKTIAEELDGLDVTFEKIKIPSAGTITFEVPGEDGNADAVKEFSAVILHQHPLFCYYKTKYSGGNNPPDCGSFDGKTGIGDPGGDCKTCPLNQYETAEEGKGKACKNRRRIYVLREGEVFPLLLSLPAGSLKEFTNYLKRLLSKGKKSGSVVTRFSLQKATSSTGVVYSQAQFYVDRALTPDEQPLIDKMAEQIKAYSKNVAFGFDDAEDMAVDPETGELVQPLGGGSDV
jgi:hypothetical protein